MSTPFSPFLSLQLTQVHRTEKHIILITLLHVKRDTTKPVQKTQCRLRDNNGCPGLKLPHPRRRSPPVPVDAHRPLVRPAVVPAEGDPELDIERDEDEPLPGGAAVVGDKAERRVQQADPQGRGAEAEVELGILNDAA